MHTFDHSSFPCEEFALVWTVINSFAAKKKASCWACRRAPRACSSNHVTKLNITVIIYKNLTFKFVMRSNTLLWTEYKKQEGHDTLLLPLNACFVFTDKTTAAPVAAHRGFQLYHMMPLSHFLFCVRRQRWTLSLNVCAGVNLRKRKVTLKHRGGIF